MQRPIRGHASVMSGNRSVQRAPDSVPLPRLIFREITGDRSACSASWSAGSTPSWYGSTHNDGSCRVRSRHVAAVFRHVSPAHCWSNSLIHHRACFTTEYRMAGTRTFLTSHPGMLQQRKLQVVQQEPPDRATPPSPVLLPPAADSSARRLPSTRAGAFMPYSGSVRGLAPRFEEAFFLSCRLP